MTHVAAGELAIAAVVVFAALLTLVAARWMTDQHLADFLRAPTDAAAEARRRAADRWLRVEGYGLPVVVATIVVAVVLVVQRTTRWLSDDPVGSVLGAGVMLAVVVGALVDAFRHGAARVAARRVASLRRVTRGDAARAARVTGRLPWLRGDDPESLRDALYVVRGTPTPPG